MGTRKGSIGTGTKLATDMAELAGIGRINSVYSNSFSLSFILDKALQLEETPVANPIIHLPASSQLPYPFKIFHYNPIAFEIGNNVLADVMVIPSHKPLLFSSKLPEKSLTSQSAFGLQFATQVSELPLNLFDFAAVIEPAVGSDSKIVYAEVNAKNPVLEVRTISLNLFSKSKQEKASSFPVYSEQTFLHIPREVFFIAVRDAEWQLDSAFNGRDAEDIILETGTSWEVVSDASSIDYGLASGFLDKSTSLFDAGYCQLGWQSSFTQGRIDERMQSDIVPDFMLPSCIDAELQGFGVDSESSDYLWSGSNFDFSCGSNNHSYYIDFNAYKSIRGDCCNSSLHQECSVSLQLDL